MCMVVGVFFFFFLLLLKEKLYFEGWEALKKRLFYIYFLINFFKGWSILPKNKAIVSRVM